MIPMAVLDYRNGKPRSCNLMSRNSSRLHLWQSRSSPHTPLYRRTQPIPHTPYTCIQLITRPMHTTCRGLLYLFNNLCTLRQNQSITGILTHYLPLLVPKFRDPMVHLPTLQPQLYLKRGLQAPAPLLLLLRPVIPMDTLHSQRNPSPLRQLLRRSHLHLLLGSRK